MQDNTKQALVDVIKSARTQVEQAFPSVYSKQDVISVLDSIADSVSEVFAKSACSDLEKALDFESLKVKLHKVVEEALDNHSFGQGDVDIDDCDFAIGWDNRVELEDCRVDIHLNDTGDLLASKIVGSVIDTIEQEQKN